MACQKAIESQTGPEVPRASGHSGTPTAQAQPQVMGPHAMAAQAVAPYRDTFTYLTPTVQRLEPRNKFPFVISSLFYYPCHDPALLIAIC